MADHFTTTCQMEKKATQMKLELPITRFIDKDRIFNAWDVFVSYGFLASHSYLGILRFGRTNNHIDYIRNKLIAVACYFLRDFFPWTLKCLLKKHHLRTQMTDFIVTPSHGTHCQLSPYTARNQEHLVFNCLNLGSQMSSTWEVANYAVWDDLCK